MRLAAFLLALLGACAPRLELEITPEAVDFGLGVSRVELVFSAGESSVSFTTPPGPLPIAHTVFLPEGFELLPVQIEARAFVEDREVGAGLVQVAPGQERATLRLPLCSNGAGEGLEACDDGNLTSGDGCDSTCKPTGCASGVATAGEVCFSENDDLRGPPNPRQVLAADLDGDELLDLVAPYPVDGVVRLYPGLGGGIFGGQADLPFPGVERLAVGDLNGDGALDLVGLSGSSASVLLNDGAGRFVVSQLPSTFGAELVGVELVDLNGDGALDLLTLDRAQGAISWRPGQGDGRFGGVEPFGQILAVGALPRAFAVADLDQDGDLDCVVVRSSGLGSVLLNDGVGQLAPSPAFLPPIGGVPSAVVVADFDGEGTLDFAVSKQDGVRGLVAIFTGTKSGGFLKIADFDAPDSPSALVATDLDLDGDIDLAATGEIDSLVAVQFNNGFGQFDPPRDATGGLFETRRAPVSLVAKDLNGDGVPDLVAAGENLGLLLSNP